MKSFTFIETQRRPNIHNVVYVTEFKSFKMYLFDLKRFNYRSISVFV